jgi:hypothetical protein
MLDVIAETEGGQRLHRNRLQDSLKATDGLVRVASAYITDTDLLSGLGPRNVRLLTSLLRMDIITGASSLESLHSLIKSGVQCRYAVGGPRLHAKVYIFGSQLAVVTSANLTWKALNSNIEAGVQLSGHAVSELVAWFDTLWNRAAPLSLKEISRWQRDTAGLRSEYSALRKKAARTRMPRSEARPVMPSPKRFGSLFGKANRFFLCNTDRRWSPVAEQRMRQRGYAAAWEDFRYPSHMREVEPGNTIFMYAKGVGIVGIGRARAPHEVLQPGNLDRIRNGHTAEWRVPVDWLAWVEDDANSFSWNSPNSTFFEVSDDKYRRLRDDVKRHFGVE